MRGAGRWTRTRRLRFVVIFYEVEALLALMPAVPLREHADVLRKLQSYRHWGDGAVIREWAHPSHTHLEWADELAAEFLSRVGVLSQDFDGPSPELVERVLLLRPLMLPVGLSPSLREAADEGRNCFRLGQFVAAIATARILLEAAPVDFAEQHQITLPDDRRREIWSRVLCRRPLRDEFERLWHEASVVAHGLQKPTHETALELLVGIYETIECLYLTHTEFIRAGVPGAAHRRRVSA